MRPTRFPNAPMTFFAISVIFLLVATLAAQLSEAQTFKVLHTFHGKDGAAPVDVLTLDAAGNLYGTTAGGGTGQCSQYGCGTAFKMSGDGKEVWLHSFKGGNGRSPESGLLRDAEGNLFGTTLDGGDINCNFAFGCGAVYQLDKTGEKETVLHKFTGPPDGSGSEAGLVRDKAGNLYGTSNLGGTGGFGTVFKIDRAGKETVLYNFTGYSDGAVPNPGVVLGPAGDLYGVTADGGSGFDTSGYGVVYKVDVSGNETVLYTFGGGDDGANPDSALLFDAQGNIYGTTANGGTGCGGTGCGTVFKLSPQSGNWSKSVLYEFCSLSNCADGEEPGNGPLVMDGAGNLYGTTYFGGAYQNCNGDACGVVFKLDTTGKETVLHSFSGSDGANPVAGVVMDNQGNLYGTTEDGGATCYTNQTCGVLFKIIP